MKRRDLLAGAGSTLLFAPIARALDALDRLRRVAVFGPVALTTENGPASLAALRQQLSELGWIEGKNIVYSNQFVESPDDSTALEAIVGTSPDLFFAVGTGQVDALRGRVGTKPIVFTDVADPVGVGYATSLAHPGGTLTGLTTFEFAMSGKWLALLKEMAPEIDHVAALFYAPDPVTNEKFLASAHSAAVALGIGLERMPFTEEAEIEQRIAAFAERPHGGLFVLPGSSLNHRPVITAAAARYGLPAIYWHVAFVQSGGLFAYGIDTIAEFRQAASYVDRLLRGSKPGDLPIEAVNKFDLVINTKTANAMGLPVPSGLLASANRVIE